MNEMPLKPDITQQVLDRIGSGTDARLRRAIGALVVHLHDYVREVELTEAEWQVAIEFLTRTGQQCVDGRQEFILLSDVLGVSMLVDAINHRRPAGATESTVFGPFYAGEQPLHPDGGTILKRQESAPPLRIVGQVHSTTGEPLEDALVEIWQVDGNGLYDVQDPTSPPGHMRASFRTLKDGSFSFVTICPVTYSIPTDGPVGQLLAALGREAQRPAHIHFMVSARGHERLVTHLFAVGDAYMDRDAVFGVKKSLIVQMDGAEAKVEFVLTPCARCRG
jgi:protocatechuate 3,4-dioxygenase beta subunit